MTIVDLRPVVCPSFDALFYLRIILLPRSSILLFLAPLWLISHYLHQLLLLSLPNFH
jgi:hypothetical protein